MALKEIREFTPEETAPAAQDRFLIQRDTDNATRFARLINIVANLNLQAFKTIVVAGQSDVVADIIADTLTLVAGNGITITTDAPTDTITIESVQRDFAEISVQGNAVATTLPTQNVFVQVTVFDTNGISNGAIPDNTQDHITISTTGDYGINVSGSVIINTVNEDYELRVHKNNGGVNFPSLNNHFDNLAANDTVSFSASGLLNLTAGDTIELFARCLSSASEAITVNDANISLTQIR